jgi:adenylylsulfate reductase subunit A
MVSNDLMGITRDDLAYDVGRNVDESVHLFEEWGLPIWKTDANGERHDGAPPSAKACPLKDGGKPVRSGKWQIMINGESYKWIVAEAAKKALGMDRIRRAHLHRQADQRQERQQPHRRCRRFLDS